MDLKLGWKPFRDGYVADFSGALDLQVNVFLGRCGLYDAEDEPIWDMSIDGRPWEYCAALAEAELSYRLKQMAETLDASWLEVPERPELEQVPTPGVDEHCRCSVCEHMEAMHKAQKAQFNEKALLPDDPMLHEAAARLAGLQLQAAEKEHAEHADAYAEARKVAEKEFFFQELPANAGTELKAPATFKFPTYMYSVQYPTPQESGYSQISCQIQTEAQTIKL